MKHLVDRTSIYKTMTTLDQRLIGACLVGVITLSILYPVAYMQVYATLWHAFLVAFGYRLCKLLDKMIGSTFLDDFSEFVQALVELSVADRARQQRMVQHLMHALRGRPQRDANANDTDSSDSEHGSDDDDVLPHMERDDLWNRLQPELRNTLRHRQERQPGQQEDATNPGGLTDLPWSTISEDPQEPSATANMIATVAALTDDEPALTNVEPTLRQRTPQGNFAAASNAE